MRQRMLRSGAGRERRTLEPGLSRARAPREWWVDWEPPQGFRPEDPASWPDLEGRLEYVEGRIQYTPPCGEEQQEVATDVTGTLHGWVRSHPDFVVGSNEAGMLLGGDVRGADAAVWRRHDTATSTGLRRRAPVLAVEIAGEDEDEQALRGKARWYLEHGTSVVWLVLPARREVVVLAEGAERRCGKGERLPAHADLPDLEPAVDELFWQLDRGS